MQDALVKARRERLRWQILQALDAARPGKVGEQLLHSMLNTDGLELTAKELSRELDYLQDRKLVRVDSKRHLGVTYLGTDIVEYTVECLPGIACPPHVPDRASKTRREQLRLRILAILDTSRPIKMPEDFLCSILVDTGIAVSTSELRRELDYLELRDLVVTDRGHDWLCDVTHYATDIVEGTSEPFPGIARPPR